ncbi:MAG TPA: DUF1223 domain-containing protein [Chitinophagaceae bacterium]|nr:DUF1223 domain-containing protein [Chitinophagaceae bacterium]
MQRGIVIVLLLAGLLVTTSMVLLKNKKVPANGGFAIVELFTSEGCSSCPPADKAVADLPGKYNSNVYVLGFHVDYWDYLGWRDIYSRAAYSRRQQQYGSIFHLGSIYTPQAIVNGSVEFTGSDTKKLAAAVEDGLSRQAEAIVNITLVTAGNNITVNYTVQAAPKSLFNVALVQKHAQSNVHAGENNGRLLHHVNVVRDFKTINIEGRQGRVVLEIPQGVPAGDCVVIAYTQDAASWKITGATAATIK